MAVRALRDALDSSIQQKYGIEPYVFIGPRAYCQYDIPVVKQSKTYYCGPAAIIEAMIGNDEWIDNAANKSATKQNEVAEKSGTTLNGTDVWQIAATLNSYYKNKTIYRYYYFSYLNYKECIGYLVDSLSYDYVPIVRITDTSAFNYYKGNSYTHYVAVSYVDYEKKKIGFVDPHYNSSFGGNREVTFSEFEKAIQQDEIWIISFGREKKDEDKN